MLEFLKNKKVVTVFDIGANKIAAITYKNENGLPIIIDIDYQKSIGIKKNQIINPNELSGVIEKVFRKVCKHKDKKNIFFSNISDTGIIVKKNETEISSGKLGISKKEVRKVFRKCIFESNRKNKKLIHSFPLKFTLDQEISTSDPLGKKCEKFAITCLNFHTNANEYDKLKHCFTKKNIKINNFFDSGVSSALGCLTENEKNIGSVCIDIGCSTTKTTAFLNGKIIYHRILPIAGNDVTTDLSHGLEISEESAEVVKIMHGTITPTFNERVEIDINTNKRKVINKNLLYGVIKPRYEEILEIIRDNLFDDIYARAGIKSIVLTGGASKIFGIENLSENIFNRKVRIGQITDNKSFFFNKPEFSTLLGLIKLSNNPESFSYLSETNNKKLSTIYDKLDNWIEESYA